jgi:capsule polysaccharide export protein KpsC/LpsZ
MENLILTQQELADALSDINIYKKQCEDEQCQKIIEFIKKGKFSNYFLDKDILKLKLKDSTVVTIIPQCLVQYV